MVNGLENMVNEMVRWNRAIITSDIHMGIQDNKCLDIVQQYIRDYKSTIKQYIDLGDGIDNPFMSKYPVDPRYVLDAQTEFDMFAGYLADIHHIIPRAKKILIPGNHDKGRLNNSKRLNRGVASLRNLLYENVLKEAIEKTDTPLKNFVFSNGGYKHKFTSRHTDLFLHGDPSMDANIKGGVTGVRRTAEMYPFNGNIYMGHSHWHMESPRRFPGKNVVSLGCLANTDKLKKMYLNHHPYENGFGIIKYNSKEKLYFFEYVPIVNGIAVAEGKTYRGKAK